MDYGNSKCKVDSCNRMLKLKASGERYLVRGYCLTHYERCYKGLSLDGSDQKFIRDGSSRHPLYRTWCSMKQRCSEWADDSGLKRSTFNQRYYAYGWSIEKCLKTPLRKVG